jgi:hypothetical protein
MDMDVTFNPGGGIRDSATENNQGSFDSVPAESKSDMQPYAIAPVVWLFVLLIGGYLGLRYIMED